MIGRETSWRRRMAAASRRRSSAPRPRRTRTASATGAIAGRVLEDRGPSIAGATVTARNLATGFRQSAISDASGALPHRGPSGGFLRRDGRGLGLRDGALGGRRGSRLRVHERGLRPEGGRRRRAGAAGAGRRAASGSHEEGPADADLRLRDAGSDRGLRPGQPGLVRRRAADQAPVLPERVRRQRQLLGERAADALRRAGLAADGLGRGQDRVRVRPLRRRRGRGPDDDPPAPGLGLARLDPRRPDEQRLHGLGTCSRTSSSTGARTGWSSSATSRCAGRRSTETASSPSPSSGRERPRTPASTRTGSS